MNGTCKTCGGQTDQEWKTQCTPCWKKANFKKGDTQNENGFRESPKEVKKAEFRTADEIKRGEALKCAIDFIKNGATGDVINYAKIFLNFIETGE